MQNLKKNWPAAWKMTWAIWQIFTRALESVKIGTLMGWDPFVQSRKCMSLKRSYASWQWRMIQKLKRNWLAVLKLTWGTSQSLTWALKSRNLWFNLLLVTKVYIAWAAKVAWSYLSWYWRVMDILRKKWLVVWKKT